MDPRDLFARLEAQYGLPRGYLDGAWAIESARGKKLVNPRSSARGHFQFLKKSQAPYGLSPDDDDTDADDRLDLAKSAEAAARLARAAAIQLSKLGAPVTPGNLYLVHQQGPSGAQALLKNPTAKAVEVLARFYSNPSIAERAIKLNGGTLDMSAGDFANHIASMFYTKAGQKPPDGGPPKMASPRAERSEAEAQPPRRQNGPSFTSTIKSLASEFSGLGKRSFADELLDLIK